MENQLRLVSRNADYAVPVLIPGKVYKSNCCAKVKFLPADQAKILASRTLKKRKNSPQDSFSSSLKRACSSNSMISSNQSEPQRLVTGKGEKDNSSGQQNAAAHVKSPSHSVFSLEGSGSGSDASSLQAKLLEVGVVSKSDLESEMIKKKGYEKYFSLRKRLISEDGPADAECHGNDSASASTVLYKPKTRIARQVDCSDHSKVQFGGFLNSPASCERLYPTYGPASERIWKGSFEVPDLPQELQLCEGLTAHCAAKISTNAYILLKYIEGVLHFNSHPCRDFWFDIFTKDGPDLQDIAVYFYPGKFERSRKEYASLLKFIEKEDLMLRCVINHVELLVYPSKVLPLDSQSELSLLPVFLFYVSDIITVCVRLARDRLMEWSDPN